MSCTAMRATTLSRFEVCPTQQCARLPSLLGSPCTAVRTATAVLVCVKFYPAMRAATLNRVPHSSACGYHNLMSCPAQQCEQRSILWTLVLMFVLHSSASSYKTPCIKLCTATRTAADCVPHSSACGYGYYCARCALYETAEPCMCSTVANLNICCEAHVGCVYRST